MQRKKYPALIFLFMSFQLVRANEMPVNLYDLSPSDEFDQIESRKLFGDDLVTSFIIFIDGEVPGHYHRFHSEHVLILEGEGVFYVGDEQFIVKAGDFIFLPKKTPHRFVAAKGQIVKALSVQAPGFDGSDRHPYDFD